MGDNELLQKILAEVQDMNAEMQGMKAEMQDMKAEMQGMKAEEQSTKKDILEIKQKINRIEVGQSEMKRELFRIDRKISDTYNLALDALGMSTENRELLENGTLHA